MDDNGNSSGGGGLFNFNSGDLITVLADLKSWEVIRKYHALEAKNKEKETQVFAYNYENIESLEPKSTPYTLGERIIDELNIYGYTLKKTKSSVKNGYISYEFNISSNTAKCLSHFIEHIQNASFVSPGFLPSIPSIVRAYTSNGSVVREFSALEQGVATIHVNEVSDYLNKVVGIHSTVIKDGSIVKSIKIGFEPKLTYRHGKIVEPSQLTESVSGCWKVFS